MGSKSVFTPINLNWIIITRLYWGYYLNHACCVHTNHVVYATSSMFILKLEYTEKRPANISKLKS